MRILFTGLPLLIAMQALAGEAVITRTRGSGHVAPDWARYEKCEIFSNRVVITRQLGREGLTAVEQTAISITGSLGGAISAAANDPVEQTDNFMCDGPSETLSARVDGAPEVLLYANGGCGTPEQRRSGPKTAIITDLVAAFCP